MQEVQQKKKLLITASTFPRYEGDTEPRFILDLAKELNKYYDVTVLAPSDVNAAGKEIIEGISVERYRYFPIHSLETLCYPGAIVPRIKEKKGRALLIPFLFIGLFNALWKRRKQFDYVHANWFIPQGIVQSFFNMPFLIMGHGADVTSLNIKPIRALKRRTVQKADHVTVVSEDLKREVLSWFPESQRKKINEKIIVQPLGCDIKRFSPSFRKENYWKQGNSKIVLFVGRLAEKKGVQYLIEAMQWVDAKLVIVGDGPLRNDLQTRTKMYNLNTKILFMGPQNHEKLSILYASADVAVVPSITAKDNDKEGFGLVILEAMASGVPVVASKSGGIVDIIEHKQNGLLVEEKNSSALAEAINLVLLNEELRGNIVNNMKETVKKYSYETVGEKYVEIMQQ